MVAKRIIIFFVATAIVGQLTVPAQESQALADLQTQVEQMQVELHQLREQANEALKKETPPPEKKTYPTVKVTGFFQADAIWFGQDAANINAVGDVQDGADFRRTRLAATGEVFKNTAYMIEMDFAFPGRPSFMDVWVDVKDTFAIGTLRAGQFRQFFAMDAMTSVRELPFLERAIPFAFVPFRQIGVGFYGASETADTTWGVSTFRYPTDFFGSNIGDNGGFGFSSRLTWVPYAACKDRYLWHVGAGYTFADPANDVVRYRNQPEYFTSETGGADFVPANVPTNVPLFVDTGAIPTRLFHTWNLETAGVWGPLHYQSEAIFSHVDRLDGLSNDFWGAYAQAGYYLTGETRSYSHTNGVLTRVDPKRPFGCDCGDGWGAWEVVARYSYIDLMDNNLVGPGNELGNFTTGLNWYLNRYTKWQAHYTHSTLDTTATQSHANIYAMRVQLDF